MWSFILIVLAFILLGFILSDEYRGKAKRRENIEWLKKRNEEEEKKSEEKKAIIRESYRKQQLEKQKILEKEKATEQEYQRNLKQLEYIQSKNQKMRDDIRNLKPMISNLSIYNDNFLEIQPVLLEYIKTAMKAGKV